MSKRQFNKLAYDEYDMNCKLATVNLMNKKGYNLIGDINTEYYKKYYQDRKDKWNDYSPKECECGLVVNCLWSHKKSKKHKDIMAILERAKLS